MNHKLEFVKISSKHEVGGVGFAGNMFIILSTLSLVGQDEKLYIDMSKTDCICTEKGPLLHNTNNCWEYYFDQVNIEGETTNNMNSLVIGGLTYENRDMYMYPENFIALKEKFNYNFQLKSYIKTLIDDFYDNNIKGKVTLGVQVRLTDMKHHHNVSPLSSYVIKINEILLKHPEIEQIFLATDDSLVIPELRAALDVPIICYDNMFRADKANRHHDPHARLHDTRKNHRYKLGIECLQEILTLTKCDYLLKADLSSISIVASILSENIKTVYKV
jgi:hypothetical protein